MENLWTPGNTWNFNGKAVDRKPFSVTSVKILAMVSVLFEIFGGGFFVGSQITLPPSDFFTSY